MQSLYHFHPYIIGYCPMHPENIRRRMIKKRKHPSSNDILLNFDSIVNSMLILISLNLSPLLFSLCCVIVVIFHCFPLYFSIGCSHLHISSCLLPNGENLMPKKMTKTVSEMAMTATTRAATTKSWSQERSCWPVLSSNVLSADPAKLW